jgi:hypothetical protein
MGFPSPTRPLAGFRRVFVFLKHNNIEEKQSKPRLLKPKRERERERETKKALYHWSQP